jgi:hypothetical protein
MNIKKSKNLGQKFVLRRKIMYRVFIEDKDGFEIDKGVFDTKEDAEIYKNIHAIDLEPGETIRIIKREPLFVKKVGIEFVSFSAYVKDRDNEKDTFYVKDLSKWNWALNGIINYPGKANEGKVQFDGGPTKAAVEVYVPWPVEDLAKKRTPSELVTLKAKLFEVAQKMLELYVKKGKGEKFCEFFEEKNELNITDFWEFKKEFFPGCVKEEIENKAKCASSPVWNIENKIKSVGREKAEYSEKEEVEFAIGEVQYILNVLKELGEVNNLSHYLICKW